MFQTLSFFLILSFFLSFFFLMQHEFDANIDNGEECIRMDHELSSRLQRLARTSTVTPLEKAVAVTHLAVCLALNPIVARKERPYVEMHLAEFHEMMEDQALQTIEPVHAAVLLTAATEICALPGGGKYAKINKEPLEQLRRAWNGLLSPKKEAKIISTYGHKWAEMVALGRRLVDPCYEGIAEDQKHLFDAAAAVQGIATVMEDGAALLRQTEAAMATATRTATELSSRCTLLGRSFRCCDDLQVAAIIYNEFLLAAAASDVAEREVAGLLSQIGAIRAKVAQEKHLFLNGLFRAGRAMTTRFVMMAEFAALVGNERGGPSLVATKAVFLPSTAVVRKKIDELKAGAPPKPLRVKPLRVKITSYEDPVARMEHVLSDLLGGKFSSDEDENNRILGHPEKSKTIQQKQILARSYLFAYRRVNSAGYDGPKKIEPSSLIPIKAHSVSSQQMAKGTRNRLRAWNIDIKIKRDHETEATRVAISKEMISLVKEFGAPDKVKSTIKAFIAAMKRCFESGKKHDIFPNKGKRTKVKGGASIATATPEQRQQIWKSSKDSRVEGGLSGRQRAAKTAMIEGSGAAQISGSAKSHLTRDPDKRDEALKKAMIGQKNAEPRRVVAGHDGTLLRTDCINDGEACIWAIEL